MTNACFHCPLCGEIDPFQVEIYHVKLRKQHFAMSPVVPTCKLCSSEIDVSNTPVGIELLILNGTCGSGKSTIAEALMQRHGYNVIDGDCVMQAARHRLGVKVEYNTDEALTEIAREFEILSAFGKKIVLSHIILPEDWVRYLALFSQYSLKYKHILLKPNMDTLLSRCQTRTSHTSVTPAYWIRHFDERLVFSDNDGIFVIDNKGLSIDETILKILHLPAKQ